MLLLDICICIIVFLIGINLKNFFPGFNRLDRIWLNRLFFFHFLVASAFHFYVESNGGDAIKYWNLPKNGTFDDIWYLVVNRKASSFMYLFNYFPANTMELTMFTGNMLYALLGYLGFVFLYKLAKELFRDEEKLYELKFLRVPVFPLILFLPNLHFWSSGIGKDTILFYCIITFIFGLINFRYRAHLVIISLVLSFLIRPHITLFLLLAFSIGYLIDGGLKGYQKIVVLIVLSVGFASIFGYVIQFIQLESLEVSSLEEYANIRVSDLSQQRTESSVDISNYPLPLKIFTFLYRPMFFDITGPLAIISSIENLFLFMFSIGIIIKKPLKTYFASEPILKGMLLFFIMGSISFSLVLGNLGIMLRQKNMFIPALIFMGIWTLYHAKLARET